MVHESEKFQFKMLLVGFLTVWLGLMLLPFITDISERPGIERLWTDPMFAPFPALLLVVYGGTWLARWSNNDAWLLNKSFWPKQVFVWIPIASVMVTSALR